MKYSTQPIQATPQFQNVFIFSNFGKQTSASKCVTDSMADNDTSADYDMSYGIIIRQHERICMSIRMLTHMPNRVQDVGQKQVR